MFLHAFALVPLGGGSNHRAHWPGSNEQSASSYQSRQRVDTMDKKTKETRQRKQRERKQDKDSNAREGQRINQQQELVLTNKRKYTSPSFLPPFLHSFPPPLPFFPPISRLPLSPPAQTDPRFATSTPAGNGEWHVVDLSPSLDRGIRQMESLLVVCHFFREQKVLRTFHNDKARAIPPQTQASCIASPSLVAPLKTEQNKKQKTVSIKRALSTDSPRPQSWRWSKYRAARTSCQYQVKYDNRTCRLLLKLRGEGKHSHIKKEFEQEHGNT